MKPGELLHMQSPDNATHAAYCPCGAVYFFKIEGQLKNNGQIQQCACDKIFYGRDLVALPQEKK